jgi:hypothetical protein
LNELHKNEITTLVSAIKSTPGLEKKDALAWKSIISKSAGILPMNSKPAKGSSKKVLLKKITVPYMQLLIGWINERQVHFEE